jgi:uncharacterized glyoxalase superfamily protein PhnB
MALKALSPAAPLRARGRAAAGGAAIEFLERARAAGADVARELTDMDYGSREFSARDPEGNVWSFGTYDPFAT